MAKKPVDSSIVQGVANDFMTALASYLPDEDVPIMTLRLKWVSILNGVAWVAARMVYALGPNGKRYFLEAFETCLDAQIDEGKKVGDVVPGERPTLH